MEKTEEQKELDKELLRECEGYTRRDNKPDGAYIEENWRFFNINKIKRLIEMGANVNAKDKWGMSPLHVTDSVAITELLISAGADVNANNYLEWLPLYKWVDKNNIAITKLLIEAGANVDVKDKYGSIPLHYTKSIALAELLISAGAKVNSKDKMGRSPLDLVIRRGNIELANFLREYEVK